MPPVHVHLKKNARASSTRTRTKTPREAKRSRGRGGRQAAIHHIPGDYTNGSSAAEEASTSLADANTTLGEMANDTVVQIEKGRRLDYTCSRPIPRWKLSWHGLKASGPNMESYAWDDKGFHVPLSLKQKIRAGSYINLALLTLSSALPGVVLF